MNPNMNMHGMQQPQIVGSGPAMMPGVSPGGPMGMQQPSPQQQQQQQQQQQPGVGMGPGGQGPNMSQQQQQQQQQQAEKMDNISKIKSLLAPLRESLFLTLRTGAFTLQQNNLADNLKRDSVTHPARFDKHLEDFYAYCDQIELHLKTAIQCMQQLSSAQHYLPGAVTAVRMEPYMQDNPAGGPMPYPAYLNTVRVHVQSAKDIHDTLMSAAQNISQAD